MDEGVDCHEGCADFEPQWPSWSGGQQQARQGHCQDLVSYPVNVTQRTDDGLTKGSQPIGTLGIHGGQLPSIQPTKSSSATSRMNRNRLYAIWFRRPLRSGWRGRGQASMWSGSEHVLDPLWYWQPKNRQYPPSFGHDGLCDKASAMSDHRTVPCWAMYPEATASEIPWKLSVSISQSNRAGVSWSLIARVMPRLRRSVRTSSRYDADPARQQVP